ncbi:hypothetical protein GCM10023217_07470 [Gordonia alkaliphila]|uniref:Uncharacterized protein n=1 Tax=Gordonia alkaliphila TaxID=1053547 RepID=A0ABP8YZK8_9ACTN
MFPIAACTFEDNSACPDRGEESSGETALADCCTADNAIANPSRVWWVFAPAGPPANSAVIDSAPSRASRRVNGRLIITPNFLVFYG